jgi:hypothetical protein
MDTDTKKRFAGTEDKNILKKQRQMTTACVKNIVDKIVADSIHDATEGLFLQGIKEMKELPCRSQQEEHDSDIEYLRTIQPPTPENEEVSDIEIRHQGINLNTKEEVWVLDKNGVWTSEWF